MTRQAYITADDQNIRQLDTMILDFLRVYYIARRFDAIDVSRYLFHTWGIRIAWHDVSSSLDRMCSKGNIDHAGFSGDRMNCYTLAKEHTQCHS